MTIQKNSYTWLEAIRDDGTPYFSPDDKAFLRSFTEKHPGIAEKFEHFLGIREVLRPRAAKLALYDLKRAGWVRRGIPDPESVFSHSIDLSGLVTYFMDNIRDHKAPPEMHRRMTLKLAHMAKIHDMPEVIATDFTPHDPVSGADKHRVEMLAAKVIFAAEPLNLQLVQEGIEQETPASHLLHDFDKIHAVLMAMVYEDRHPEKAGIFKEFFDYSHPRMKTAAGTSYLEGFAQDREQVVAVLRNPPVATHGRG